MSPKEKIATDKPKRRSKILAEPAAQKPGRPAVATPARPRDKLLGGVTKFNSRRKLPSGPLGGSGRKTNLARKS